MISVRSLVTLLLAGTLLFIPISHGLECYSCSTDSSDLDCDNLATLEKVSCTPFSATNHPVQPVCGYKRLIPSSSDAPERIWRGCAVSGECALLSRQGNEAFNSVFRMSACEECEEQDCNGPKNHGTIVHQGRLFWYTVSLLAVVNVALLKGRD
uniref:Protein sleepless n=1 Tax=Anopheles culicifacies TaxID=139723 RepID=A0A182LWK4_9DIPT